MIPWVSLLALMFGFILIALRWITFWKELTSLLKTVPMEKRGVPRWFKTPDGTDGFSSAYLSDTSLTNVLMLGNEEEIVTSDISENTYAAFGILVSGGPDPSASFGYGPPDGRGVKINSIYDIYQVVFDTLVPAGTTYRLRVRKDPSETICYPEIEIEESSDGMSFHRRSSGEFLNVNSYSWTDIYLVAERDLISLSIRRANGKPTDNFELDAIIVGKGAAYPNLNHQLIVPVLNANLRFKQFDGITGFSGGTLAVPVTSQPVTFPVEWLEFTAEKVDSNVILTWITGMEINNQKFEIERSFNGQQFATVGQKMAKGQPATYQFLDRGAGMLKFNRIFLPREADRSGWPVFLQ